MTKKGLLIYPSKELKERIREVAFKNKMSMSKIIQIALRNQFKFIEHKKEVNENNGTGQSIGNTGNELSSE